MYQMTQFSGFGTKRQTSALGSDVFLTRTDIDENTNSPSFSLDLGTVAGTKQVVVAFGMDDNDVDDAFNVTATLGGAGMTLIHEAGRFSGSSSTVGASLFRIETTATGVVTVAATIAGFTGTMDRSVMGAIVMNNYNPVPVDTASADSAVEASATLSVTGARLVVVAGARLTSGPGDLTGPGSKTMIRTNVRTAIGYSILSQTGNKTFQFTNAANAIVAASFALA